MKHTYRVWQAEQGWRAQCSCMDHVLMSKTKQDAEDDRRVHLAWVATQSAATRRDA